MWQSQAAYRMKSVKVVYPHYVYLVQPACWLYEVTGYIKKKWRAYVVVILLS